MQRKAQSEVITTVLIILLVLAAVFIVWTAIKGMIDKNISGAEGRANCLGLDLTVKEVKNTSLTNIQIGVSRGTDNTKIEVIKVLLANATNTLTSSDINTNIPGALEEKILSLTSPTNLVNGNYQIRLAPKVGTFQCDVVATKDFTI